MHINKDLEWDDHLYLFKMFVCLCVWNSWGHNVGNVEMTESKLHREWVLELSKCVYVKFHQIDFSKSQDIAKKQIFFSKIDRIIR